MVRISEKKPLLFNVKGPGVRKQPTSMGAQNSAAPGGIQVEQKEMLQKQILGQGDYKGDSHVLNDPNSSVDRGLHINDWSLAFNGIQERSSKFGKEVDKNHIPESEGYATHFVLGQ